MKRIFVILVVAALAILLGNHAIKRYEIMKAHVPLPYDYDRVEEHHEHGSVDLAKITLYLSDGQQNSNHIPARKLLKELKSKNLTLLNAKDLDSLLARPEIIPKDWKQKQVCFFGTIYELKSPRGSTFVVPSLFWNPCGWWITLGVNFEEDYLGDNYPVAVISK